MPSPRWPSSCPGPTSPKTAAPSSSPRFSAVSFVATFSSLCVVPDNKGGFSLSPDVLFRDGPRLVCEVCVDDERANALRQAGQEVPPPQRGYVLVDTGASRTAIDEGLLKRLGIPPVGDASVCTPAGQQSHNIYPCGFLFPGTQLLQVQQAFVVACALEQQGIVGLIGRDPLRHAIVVYDGALGYWSIAF